MKSREWLERGLEKSDPIDLFTDSWRGFNHLYYPSHGGSEREKISNFLAQSVPEEVAQKLINNHDEETTYLISKPVIDMRGNGKDTTQYIKKYADANSYIERLEVVFQIIYQVRCNLEHGQKSPSRKRDIKLCESAWPLVAEVVDRNT